MFVVITAGFGIWKYLDNRETKRIFEKNAPKETIGQTTTPNPQQNQGNSGTSALVPVYQGKGFSLKVESDAQNDGVTLGSIKTADMQMFVENGTFPENTRLEAQPIAQEHLDVIKNSGKFEKIITPMNISCDQYDGSFFGSDVMLTMLMPRLINEGEKAELNKYVFVCYDENTKQMHYLWPTEYDTEKNTMTVRMPHFSLWFTAEMTNEQKIEAYLDSYSMKVAIQNDLQKQAAVEIQPYVEAKVKALGLTKEAAKDLLQSTINIVVSKATSNYEYKDGTYGFQESFGYTAGTKALTSTIRGFWDKDNEAIKDGMKDLVNSSLMEAWSDLKFNDRAAATLFKSAGAQELASGAIGTVASNTSGIAKMAGYLAEGDTKDAMMELGNILQGINPAVELGTKGAKFLAEAANTAFTNWKANEVEELYRIYKNGGSAALGNEVLPGNKDNTFVEYLNSSSGPTKAKCVYRFYNMDKAAEVCKKFGWSTTDYDKLDQHYKDIFNQRALDGLLKYFETRRKQEAEAEKIKAMERKSIEAMLGDFGALNADYHNDYFGEDKFGKNFNVSNRLERIAHIRSTIAKFVDEKKLAQSIKDDGLNWGNLVNEWIRLVENEPKEDVTRKFCEFLKESDLLKEGLDPAEETKETDGGNGGYCWRLVKADFKAKETKKNGNYTSYYSGSQNTHTIRETWKGEAFSNDYANYPPPHYEFRPYDVTFTATIDTPPAIIEGGDSIVLHVTLNLNGEDNGFHCAIHPWIEFAEPDYNGVRGTVVNVKGGGIGVSLRYGSPKSGEWDYVLHIPSGRKNQMKYIQFCTGGVTSYWYYKWCTASDIE